jgi:hypothetical protein
MFNNSKIQLDISELTQGVYLAKVLESNGHNSFHKFIKL